MTRNSRLAFGALAIAYIASKLGVRRAGAPLFPGGANNPRGIRNNNPLNIRLVASNKWRGKIRGNDNEFETFSSPEFGIRAAAILFKNRGLRPLDEHIRIWAPPSENDTAAYVRAVANEANVGPTSLVPTGKRQLVAVLTAMIRHENGQQPYSLATIARGVEMADV